MARPLRIELPGAVYHVTSRGNARQKIYRDDEDREAFLTTLAWVVKRFGWMCHAYCLMDNHFHLLIETPQPTLSRGMRQLNGVYTQRFNRRHRRIGHLFQGRFKAILIERDAYLLELARYIVLNPVRARMVKNPSRYPWSSYRPTLGLDPAPSGLMTGWVLDQFARTKPAARGRYAAFVNAGIGNASPWRKLKAQVLLGGKTFVRHMMPRLEQSSTVATIARRWRRPALKTLLAGMNSKAARDKALAQAYLQHGYTLVEIGRAAGLHYATVSRIIKAMEEMP